MNKKRIVCFGDSNTWGYDIRTQKRFDDSECWTSILQKKLGSDYLVHEEGLKGRTTVFDDPLVEGLNGLSLIVPILQTHEPIAMLVLMLGTNDCKQRFSATAKNIADGLECLIKKAKSIDVWQKEANILVVAPITIREGCYTAFFSDEMGKHCVEKSEKLPALFREKAESHNCLFWDCNEELKASGIDFMHLDEKAGEIFAERVSKIVLENC